MFGSREVKTDSENERHERLMRQRAETLALFASLAKAAAPEIERAQQENLAAAQAEYERDSASYSFSCERRGDFLSVQIARGYDKSVLGETPVSVSTTLNLRGTKQITLSLGYAPDRAGRLPVSFDMTGENGGTLSYGNSSQYSPQPAPKGYVWKAKAPYFYLPGRPHYREDSSDNGNLYFDRDYYDKPMVEAVARAAQDDTIYFSGIGITIFAPAGHGEGAHEKIMTALAQQPEAAR
jgi:hypothetical protein